MTILLVIADLGLGGAQQVVINFANELVKQGHRVILYDVYPTLRKDGMINKLNINVELISPDFNTTAANIYERVSASLLYRTGINKNYIVQKRLYHHQLELKKVVENESVDAVNSHVFWADEFVSNNLKFLHKKWWITLHGSYLELSRRDDGNSFQPKVRKFVSQAQGFIFLADEEMEFVKSLKDDQKQMIFYFIPNGVELEKYRIKEIYQDRVKTILIASRAIREKGWVEAIHAVIELNRSGFEINLLLAGDGPLLNDIRLKYEQFEFIHFLGYRTDVIDLISSVDIVLLPSYHEMFPTILVESVASGVPVIATNCGSTKNIITVDSKECGLLLTNDIKNLESTIKSAILKYLNNSDLYKLHAKNTLAKREVFDVKNMVRYYLDLFTTVE
jgi:glycosyltransferase involved in cell wall biosynthesis